MAGPYCKPGVRSLGIYGWHVVCSHCPDWHREHLRTKQDAIAMFRAHKHDLPLAWPQDIRDAMRNLEDAGLLE